MQTSNKHLKSQLAFESYVKKRFITHNNLTNDQYTIKIVNDLLFNEKSHLVSSFKDFLIYDDSSEFFKRFYQKKEIKKKLMRILDYYERSSRVFPNYTILFESKYIYKNIQKKQKVIDEIQQMSQENKAKLKAVSRNQYNNSFKLTEIFDTEAFDVLNEPSKSDYIGIELFNLEFNITKNELIEDEEIKAIDNILTNIESEEKKQVALIHINELKKNKLKLNTKNILITQTLMMKKGAFIQDKKNNESMNINLDTSYKETITLTQPNTNTNHNQLFNINVNQRTKAHRILKSCVFSIHQKNLSSISSMKEKNIKNNSQNGSKLLSTHHHYFKTEANFSPAKKILLPSKNYHAYNKKSETRVKHYRFKNKINPKSFKLKPRNPCLPKQMTFRERIQTHMHTVTSPIIRKFAIPILNNKATNVNIQIKHLEALYQSRFRSTLNSNTRFPNNNALTSRNISRITTDRNNEAKLHLTWKKIKK